ncbi:MAG: T9SS type A sorting domain-containing protein [Ignavibacteriae bacterium]|nr:T9SS type A sorting domain-containing protein [Ignavibacteriota bacterium]
MAHYNANRSGLLGYTAIRYIFLMAALVFIGMPTKSLAQDISFGIMHSFQGDTSQFSTYGPAGLGWKGYFAGCDATREDEYTAMQNDHWYPSIGSLTRDHIVNNRWDLVDAEIAYAKQYQHADWIYVDDGLSGMGITKDQMDILAAKVHADPWRALATAEYSRPWMEAEPDWHDNVDIIMPYDYAATEAELGEFLDWVKTHYSMKNIVPFLCYETTLSSGAVVSQTGAFIDTARKYTSLMGQDWRFIFYYVPGTLGALSAHLKTHAGMFHPEVSITGPNSVCHPEKGSPPNEYTWTANASYGTPAYTYLWYRDGNYVGSGPTYSITCYAQNPGGGSSDFSLQVRITDSWLDPMPAASGDLTVTEYGTCYIPPKLTPRPEAGTPVKRYECSISNNYQSSFNTISVIRYSLAGEATVSVRVYDVLGKVVSDLTSGIQNNGSYTVRFDGSKLGSGLYFARVVLEPLDGSVAYLETLKIVLSK